MARLKQLKGSLTRLPPRVSYLERDQAEASRSRDARHSWRAWYKTARWQRLRMSILMRDAFTCQMRGCGAIESDTSQLVADHKVPHRGDPDLFWDETNLWCLCKRCHDSTKQREEAAARRSKGR